MNDAVDDAFDGIEAFIKKTREELKQRSTKGSNSALDLSFNPKMVPGYVASRAIVKKGMYDSCCGSVHVEVLHQDLQSGLVHVEIYDEPDPYKRFDFISTGMFLLLFKPKSVVAYVLGGHPPK